MSAKRIAVLLLAAAGILLARRLFPAWMLAGVHLRGRTIYPRR